MGRFLRPCSGHFRTPWALGLLVAACSDPHPAVSTPDAGYPLDAPAIDAPAIDAAPLADAGPCLIDDLPAIEPAPVDVWTDEDADVAVALPADFTTEEVVIPDPWLTEAAGVFSSPEGIYGFWLSRPGTGGDAVSQSMDVEAAIELALAAYVPAITIMSEGLEVTTHDGFPAVVDRDTRIDIPGALPVSYVRNLLLAELLSRSVADLGLELPTDDYVEGMVLRFATVRRSASQVVVIASLLERQAFSDRESAVGGRVRALADGTALAGASYGLQRSCTEATALAVARMDVIVPSKKGTLDGLESLVGCGEPPSFCCPFDRFPDYAVALYDRLLSSGLDARIAGGMPPLDRSNDISDPAHQPLCPDDSFLAVTDENRQAFQDCVVADIEGLIVPNTLAMIEGALPRAEEPTSIRPDAQLVVVALAGSALCELGVSCGPTPGYLSSLELLGLLYAQSFINDEAILYTVGQEGMEPYGCPHLTAGIESFLTVPTGGESFNWWYDTPADVAEHIVRSSVAAASPYPLAEEPVSASLAVSGTDGIMTAVPNAGFEYLGVIENALRVRGQTMVPGAETRIAVTYDRWVEQEVE